MTRKVRICKACGVENPSTERFCSCGQSIMNIPPQELLDAPTTVPLPCSEIPEGNQKQCSVCAKMNESHRLTCDCGERLTSEAPGTAGNPANSPSTAGVTTIELTPRKLTLVIGAQRTCLKDGDILGRSGTVEASSFFMIQQVSREHVRMVLLNSQWHVIPLSENMTELDGIALPRGRPSPLLEGIHSMRLSSKCQLSLEVT